MLVHDVFSMLSAPLYYCMSVKCSVHLSVPVFLGRGSGPVPIGRGHDGVKELENLSLCLYVLIYDLFLHFVNVT